MDVECIRSLTELAIFIFVVAIIYKCCEICFQCENQRELPRTTLITGC